jgi:hypothetical protein
MTFGKEKIKKGGPGVSDVEKPGGGRREANPNI